MKYWMKFYSNNNEEIISISDLVFTGVELNIAQLKDRFNKNFVQNKQCKGVKISFLGNKVSKSFFAGFRNGNVVIIDSDSRKEYSAPEFSAELNQLERILNDQPNMIECWSLSPLVGMYEVQINGYWLNREFILN